MKTIFAVAALALASLVPASAENIVNIDLPFSFSGIATPCTADSIDVTGTAHIVVHATADGAGGFHGGLHINVSASGTGTPGAAIISAPAAGHSATHCRQPVHSADTMLISRSTGRAEGQALAHLPQSMHSEVSRRMRNGLAREASPKSAPYGHRYRHQKFCT